MRREFAFVILAFLAVPIALSQQATGPTPPAPAAQPPDAQTAYYAGPGVTAPELLPVTVTDLATGHCKKLDGTVTLSVIVDATGTSREVIPLRPTGTGLDQEAIRLVTAESFKPGTYNGTPAATVNSIDVNLKACTEEKKNEAGQKLQVLRLQSAPDQNLRLMKSAFDATRTFSSTSQSLPEERESVPRKLGPDISPPVLVQQETARFSDEALRAKYQGMCVMTLIVDEHGMPQNVHVIRSLGMGLDEKALEAVRQYRFKPARNKKDGKPVAVMITVEVDFHLYK